VVLADEARRSRHRLYPVTVIYSSVAALVLGLGIRSNPAVALVVGASGLVFWTLAEYLVHRYFLHGIFPDRGSVWSRALNRAFDHLHWQHHLRPWDGNHINGTLFDTLWVVAPVWTLTFLAPVHTAPAFVAGFMLGYVIEEWCHHSVHFYLFDWRWFRGLKTRHFYHHSRLGAHILFGLSNGFWDDVVGTGMPVASAPARESAETRRPVVTSLTASRRSLQIRIAARPDRCGERPGRRPHVSGPCSSEPRA
jgi:sterol desaturase/sphingolipid hydroxylase (fatty acid hydroxylase superfamily)